MYIKETVFSRAVRNRAFWVPRPDYLMCNYYRYATMINCFFHRNANDGIRYNVTNIRQFTREDDDIFEDDMRYWSSRFPDKVLYEVVEINALEDFFKEIGFDYKTKTWLDSNEFSMRWDRNNYKFVVPRNKLK